jgi:hypothetical protein
MPFSAHSSATWVAITALWGGPSSARPTARFRVAETVHRRGINEQDAALDGVTNHDDRSGMVRAARHWAADAQVPGPIRLIGLTVVRMCSVSVTALMAPVQNQKEIGRIYLIKN